jgi:hypothetical protein
MGELKTMLFDKTSEQAGGDLNIPCYWIAIRKLSEGTKILVELQTARFPHESG